MDFRRNKLNPFFQGAFMNEDFYYFFSLFKDNCVFNEALNTARYRYGLDPERYLNLYSDIVNDPGNTHLI